MKAVYVIVCTKPLQWFNALNIDFPGQEDRILIVVNSFKDAVIFYNRVKEYDATWSDVIFGQTREDSYALVKQLASQYTIERLYVDCDYGSIGGAYAKLPVSNLYVIEEGLGPYVDKVKKGTPKRLIFKLKGWGAFLGGNSHTKGIYLYNHSYYRHVHKGYKKEILSFRTDFFSALAARRELLEKVAGLELPAGVQGGKKVAFYLTAYSINPDVIKFLTENIDQFDNIIIKIHPHLANNFRIEDHTDKIPAEKLTVMSNSVLAEIIISRLAEGNELTVVHESSTTCLYVDENSMKVINMGKVLQEEFGTFRKMYLENFA
ncbi:hypothetical protein SIO70_18335 [Chitinophaga sancti]|uniref:hypothetical protein n=1 Tax=Chitinophaga sancti TaxID=1004 RepID=UPI002A747EF0|nr:hypothetical protein [Chitinophaga sancti]WPQ60306.1 hypothetical protein SIO70_18335 [Chitinophaga sancti]